MPPQTSPILLFNRRYVSYCIPLVAVDAAEKQLAEAGSFRAKALWGVLVVVLGALLLRDRLALSA